MIEIFRTIWYQDNEYTVIKEYDEVHFHAYRVVSGHLIEFYRYCMGAEYVYTDIPEVIHAALEHMKYSEEIQAREDREVYEFECKQVVERGDGLGLPHVV